MVVSTAASHCETAVLWLVTMLLICFVSADFVQTGKPGQFDEAAITVRYDQKDFVLFWCCSSGPCDMIT